MKLNIDYSGYRLQDLEAYQQKITEIHEALENRNGKGADYLGWIHYAAGITPVQLAEIITLADEIREEAQLLIVCGIGGSFLGAKALIDALSTGTGPEILFTGNSLSSDDLAYVLNRMKDRSVYLNVISKSGTTLETAVSFRILRAELEKQFPEDAARRIIATTDPKGGALRQLSLQEGYRMLEIPPDIGGRYSVMTPVGLLPAAAAGIDIHAFLRGMIEGSKQFAKVDLADNIAYQYGLLRHLLYQAGKKIELMVFYEPRLRFLGQWYMQLFGESEGKERQGIFPASLINTMDLHSMGQYVQEGERHLFETVVMVETPSVNIVVPEDADNLDGLNYLAGKNLQDMNEMARRGTLLAHVEGGVPNLLISIPKLDAFTLGKLMYFYMKSCAVTGYLADINPFDQPGVEDYKRNMFALLEKPGTEEQLINLRSKMKEFS